jgi:hypothetical protein
MYLANLAIHTSITPLHLGSNKPLRLDCPSEMNLQYLSDFVKIRKQLRITPSLCYDNIRFKFSG